MLDCGAHERVEQLVEDHLARDGLRHLDHRHEVELLERCADRASRDGNRLLRPQVRIAVIQIPYLAICTPMRVAGAGIPQMGMTTRFQSKSEMEFAGEFV